MAPSDALHLLTEAMLLALILSMPPIVVATIVGLAVSLLQALTQIQEQTLPFGIKLVAMAITLAGSASYFGNEMLTFTIRLLDTFPELTR